MLAGSFARAAVDSSDPASAVAPEATVAPMAAAAASLTRLDHFPDTANPPVELDDPGNLRDVHREFHPPKVLGAAQERHGRPADPREHDRRFRRTTRFQPPPQGVRVDVQP